LQEGSASFLKKRSKKLSATAGAGRAAARARRSEGFFAARRPFDGRKLNRS
jgi:hypothetical protein